MNRTTRETILPLMIALIWGFAFVFQSIAADYIGTFTFNFSRSLLAVIVLAPIAYWAYIKNGLGEKTILGGCVVGIVLAAASCLQQSGIEETSAGKAAFITAMYIMLVPFGELFFGKKPSFNIIIGIIIAVFGMYFLCVTDGISINRYDLLVILSSISYTVQILLIDHYAPKSNDILMSWFMFVSMTITCGILMLIFEEFSIELLKPCLGSIIYAGVFSSGVGYTLQIVAQNGTDPTIVSLFMSMESVFALFAGTLILNEKMTVRETLGCTLMIIAIILCKLPIRKKK